MHIWPFIISKVYSLFYLSFLYYTYISNYKGNINKNLVFRPFFIARAFFTYYLVYKHCTSFIALWIASVYLIIDGNSRESFII